MKLLASRCIEKDEGANAEELIIETDGVVYLAYCDYRNMECYDFPG